MDIACQVLLSVVAAVQRAVYASTIARCGVFSRVPYCEYQGVQKHLAPQAGRVES